MEKKNFEESIKALEEIIHALEAGNLSLEETIKKYQEGLELSKSCHDMLENAQKVLDDKKE